jgi:hypothetical protein
MTIRYLTNTCRHVLYAHPSVIIHLTNLFNAIIKHAHVPDQFGLGIVIPLVKDKSGDLSNSDNYRAITVSPVLSKIFEMCILHKFGSFFYSHDLQLGFKKGVGCGPAVFAVQETVKHFTDRGSTVYAAALDATKAFDRVNHGLLFRKLQDRNVPPCLINTLACWYSKLHAVVRWNASFSEKFQVCCGVRQGGILSPLLFNVYVDDLIQELSTDGFGCHISQTFFGCIMHADDILLLSPSIHGLQCMLDRCNVYGRKCDILFNPKKSVCIAIGFKADRTIDIKMNIGDNEIQWVSELKYLGVHFKAARALDVNITPIKHKFYGAFNSLMSRCKYAVEPVKLQLLKSFCMPLLSFCLGAMNLKKRAVAELSVCWNDAFRKIFNMQRFESVKELIFYCGETDFSHMYDLARIKFLRMVCSKFSYCIPLYCCSEWRYNTLSNLVAFYDVKFEHVTCWRGAVKSHFQYTVMDDAV